VVRNRVISLRTAERGIRISIGNIGRPCLNPWILRHHILVVSHGLLNRDLLIWLLGRKNVLLCERSCLPLRFFEDF